jgi:hypothetical protein
MIKPKFIIKIFLLDINIQKENYLPIIYWI